MVDGVMRSILLRRTRRGLSRALRVERTWMVVSQQIWMSGWEASKTIRRRSARAASSRVERKASMSWCGRSLTKPTVSVIRTVWPLGRRRRRVVGSSVAKRRSWARTLALVRRLRRVDLPLLV